MITSHWRSRVRGKVPQLREHPRSNQAYFHTSMAVYSAYVVKSSNPCNTDKKREVEHTEGTEHFVIGIGGESVEQEGRSSISHAPLCVWPFHLQNNDSWWVLIHFVMTAPKERTRSFRRKVMSSIQERKGYLPEKVKRIAKLLTVRKEEMNEVRRRKRGKKGSG